MAKFDRVRDLALSILDEIELNHRYSTEIINEKLKEKKDDFDRRDAGFIRELIYGVLENKLYLEYMINQVSNRKLKKMKSKLRNIFYLSVYEIFFLDTPDHAAVNEYVNLTKRYAFHAKGFVNGVLRNMIRKKDEISQVDTGDSVKDISIRYSHPLWILEVLEEYFSEEQILKILKKNNQVAPISIFVNPKKITRDKALEILEKEGLGPVIKSEISQYALLLEGGNITGSELFQTGAISIQSQASIKTAELSVKNFSQKEIKILDLCAAPGSKTMTMASLTDRAHIVANDIAENKKERLEENIDRFSYQDQIELSFWDGEVLNEAWLRSFDIVLVDAPCSGLGLLRKKPDIRWNRKKEDIQELQKIQTNILNNAKEYVRPGGELIYSTCTYGRMENENLVALLEKDKDWENIPLSQDKYLHFIPLQEDTDGFFISKFKHIKE